MTEEKNVLNCDCNMSGGGFGKLQVTEDALIWRASTGANLLGIGLLTAFTKKSQAISIDSIMYFERKGKQGLEIFKSDGKKVRFGFSKAEHCDILLKHLQSKKK